MRYAIDFGSYMRPVRANARSAGVLAVRLENAAPPDLTADERGALNVVVESANAVRAANTERDRLQPPKTRPEFDAHLEAWAAIHAALGAVIRLRRTERGARARALRDLLFPSGLAFLRLSASSCWSEGHRHLARIEDEGLRTELDALIGPEFLILAKATNQRLADVVGVGRVRREVADPTAITEGLAKFGRAVGAYARIIAAKVDETDDASAQRFLSAMAPIHTHRVQSRRRNSRNDAAPGSPDEPIDPSPA